MNCASAVQAITADQRPDALAARPAPRSAATGLARRQSNGAAPLRRQRLGQHEAAVAARLTSASAPATKNGSCRSMAPSRPPITGPRMKPRPNIAPSRPKRARAVLGRRDVGDVGVGDRDVGLHRAAEQAHGDQHPQRGGQRGDEEAERQAAEAEQQHRPAAVAVGQRAEERRAEEVGDAEGEA